MKRTPHIPDGLCLCLQRKNRLQTLTIEQTANFGDRLGRGWGPKNDAKICHS